MLICSMPRRLESSLFCTGTICICGLLPQATLAYQSGNKALAKELGAKGRAANEAMQAAHSVASANIFTSRNTAHAQVLCLLLMLSLLLHTSAVHEGHASHFRNLFCTLS